MRESIRVLLKSKISFMLILFFIFGAISVFAGNIIVNEHGIQSDNYYANDGSQGITQDITYKDGHGNSKVLVIKNGLVVDVEGEGGGNEGNEDWWDSDWSKRSEITVINAGSYISNYTLELNIPYTANMNSDFSDLRFIDSDYTTVLGYYIKNKTDSDNVEILVKIPELSANSNHLIYMYYGNAIATTKSSPYNAYLVYDDFTQNNGIWTINDPYSHISIDYSTNHRIDWSGLRGYQSSFIYTKLKDTNISDFEATYKVYFSSLSTDARYIFGLGNSIDGDLHQSSGKGFFNWYYQNDYFTFNNKTGTTETSINGGWDRAENFNANKDYYVILRKIGKVANVEIYRTSNLNIPVINDLGITEDVNFSYFVPVSSYNNIGSASYSATGYTTNITLRKLSRVGISYSIGSEESQ